VVGECHFCGSGNRAVELTGKDQGAFQPLHKSTGGIISHAATPVCGLPAVGMLCK
jgi:hypothetical protein